MNAPTSKSQGLLAWIAQVVAELRHQRARRGAYRALSALDDRTLEDIGIGRHEIWIAIDESLGAHPGEVPAGNARPVHGLGTPQRGLSGVSANDTDTTVPKRPLAA